MASRNRNSTAMPVSSRSSLASSVRRDATDDLPPYKKPSHPLDQEAARSLRELQGKNLDSVKKHTKQATAAIKQTAESVNDALREHAQYIERRQKKWDAGKNLDDKEEEERIMEELQKKVDKATSKLEESMRAVIDSGTAAQRIDDTLDWLRQNAPKQLENEYQTQMTERATQRQSQMASQRQTQEDDDVSMDAVSTPGPTPLDGSRVALTGATELFTTRMQHEKDSYTALSLTARYARNNDYRDFKGLVNLARHGDEAPNLGHENTWFTEAGAPDHGITDSTQRGEFDDDDDIIVDKATISTRCPLTYQQFKEPFTSTKCPHTFEKNAILEMIRNSANKIGGRGPGARIENAVECPVNGCSKLLTVRDLRADPILIRRIRRIQKAEAEDAEESSDEEMEDEVPRSSGRPQGPGTQHTIIEDLGDPTDTEEEEV